MHSHFTLTMGFKVEGRIDGYYVDDNAIVMGQGHLIGSFFL